MSLRELAANEYAEWKNRMHRESEGTYILIYLALIFSVFFEMLFGLYYESDAFAMLIFMAFFISIIYEVFTMYLSRVKEKGLRVNIFEKYIYTPVDMNMLVKAKMIVLCRILALPIILGQLASVLICIMDPDKVGTNVLNGTVWMPVIIGALFIVGKYFEYKKMLRNAKK